MRIIGIDTGDEYLARRIELELYGKYATVRVKNTADTVALSAVIRDTDTAVGFAARCRIITVSRTEEADLSIPFPLGALEALLSSKIKGAYLSLDASRRVAAVGERTVKLTELEFSLLSLLVSGKGKFISREEIRTAVWEGNAEDGLINIYVHYLRDKLERGGERIILSSRKSGYAIDERFLGGDPFAETH